MLKEIITKYEKIFLFGILIIASLLRIYLAWVKEFHADELYGLLSSQGIFQNGFPHYPSGTYDELGGLLLYIQAPLIKIFGYHAFIARLPGLLFSIFSLYIFLLFW